MCKLRSVSLSVNLRKYFFYSLIESSYQSGTRCALTVGRNRSFARGKSAGPHRLTAPRKLRRALAAARARLFFCRAVGLSRRACESLAEVLYETGGTPASSRAEHRMSSDCEALTLEVARVRQARGSQPVEKGRDSTPFFSRPLGNEPDALADEVEAQRVGQEHRQRHDRHSLADLDAQHLRKEAQAQHHVDEQQSDRRDRDA